MALVPVMQPPIIDIVTILLGFCVGASINAQYFLHAMAPNVAGITGSAIAAGVLWSQLGGVRQQDS